MAGEVSAAIEVPEGAEALFLVSGQLRLGQLVRVRKGLLRGATGCVIGFPSASRVLLSVAREESLMRVNVLQEDVELS